MSFKLVKTNQAFCEEHRAVEFEQVLVETGENSNGVGVESKIVAVWNTWGMSFVVKADCVSNETRYYKYYEKHFKTYEEAREFDLDLPMIFNRFLMDNKLDVYRNRKVVTSKAVPSKVVTPKAVPSKVVVTPNKV